MAVGMDKNLSRFGRRSNWFKHKFNLEDDPQYQQSIDALGPAAALRLHPYLAEQMAMQTPFKFDRMPEVANQFYSSPMQLSLRQSLIDGEFTAPK